MSSRSKRPPQTQKQIVHQKTEWSYPVPPPDLFNRYDPVVKEQLLKEWSAEAEHRRKCEETMLAQRSTEIKTQSYDVQASHRYDLVAISVSFALIIILLLATILFAYIGKPIEAVASLIATLSLFFFRKKSEK